MEETRYFRVMKVCTDTSKTIFAITTSDDISFPTNTDSLSNKQEALLEKIN